MIDEAGNLVMKVYDIPILVSTNEMYRPTVNRKTHHCFFRKSNELQAFQDAMRRLFESETICTKSDLEEFYNCNKNSTKLVLLLKIYLPKSKYCIENNPDKLAKSDCSNFIKSIEDSIASWLGIDDRYNESIVCTKTIHPKNKYGFIAILSSSDYYNKVGELFNRISYEFLDKTSKVEDYVD